MSTVRKPTGSSPEPASDNPHRYGWREVCETDTNGREVWKLQPLTEEEILHPRLGDHVTQNQPHADDTIYLKDVFTVQVSGIEGAQVFFDLLVKWDIPGLGDHGPDIMVVFGARRLVVRESLNVAEAGVRPALIIEVTSPATRRIDLRTKPGQYWRAGVPCYVIVDATVRRGQRQLRLIGRQRGARRWRQMRPDAQGRLWLEAVRLWLGQENGRVVCYDEQGNRLGDFTEVTQARQEAEQQAADARQQAADAEQRATDAVRAAAAERKRARAAEKRLREMEAELRRLRGEEQ